jgi:hypothetical protein
MTKKWELAFPRHSAFDAVSIQDIHDEPGDPLPSLVAVLQRASGQRGPTIP